MIQRLGLNLMLLHFQPTITSFLSGNALFTDCWGVAQIPLSCKETTYVEFDLDSKKSKEPAKIKMQKSTFVSQQWLQTDPQDYNFLHNPCLQNTKNVKQIDKCLIKLQIANLHFQKVGWESSNFSLSFLNYKFNYIIIDEINVDLIHAL